MGISPVLLTPIKRGAQCHVELVEKKMRDEYSDYDEEFEASEDNSNETVNGSLTMRDKLKQNIEVTDNYIPIITNYSRLP